MKIRIYGQPTGELVFTEVYNPNEYTLEEIIDKLEYRLPGQYYFILESEV